MRIENDMHVAASIDEAWALLTDIPAIAPCLPGAELTGQDGDTYEGTMKVKVGPVTAEYAGSATITEMDEANRTVKLTASGRDKRGAGNASADIEASMVETDGGTTVSIATDLKISGKVAQFGRGVMADVSKKLLGQFAECIESKLESPEEIAEAVGSASAEMNGDGPTAAAGASDDSDDDVLDLMDVAGGAVAKRLVPVVGAIVATIILYFIFR